MEPSPHVVLHPTGMSCGHCVRAVQEALDGVEGVNVEEVSVGTAVVTVADPRTDWAHVEPQVRDALHEAGYPLP